MTQGHLFAILAALFLGLSVIGLVTCAVIRIREEIRLSKYNQTVDRR